MEDKFTPAAERTLLLIDILMAEPEGMLPTDLIGRLDMSRSTLFSLLKTLREQGYLEQAEPRGRYRLGPKLLAWRSAPVPAPQDLLAVFFTETAQTVLEETLGLAWMSSEGPYLLTQIEGKQVVRCVFTLRTVYPDLSAVQQLLNPSPELEIQEKGYTLLQRGDVLDLALPICRDGVHPDAALVLSAPLFRWNKKEVLSVFLDEVRGIAARISYRLGAQFYSPFYSLKSLSTHMDKNSSVKRMNTAEMTRFLHGPWTARLACVRPDGFPHVITLWQEWDGQVFYIIAWKGSQWSGYLQNNDSVSLTVDEPFPPFRRVMVDGKAVKLNNGEYAQSLDKLVSRLAKRYIGQEMTGLQNHVEGAFCIVPDNIRGIYGLPTLLQSLSIE